LMGRVSSGIPQSNRVIWRYHAIITVWLEASRT
jgi:hypothetical protein